MKKPPDRWSGGIFRFWGPAAPAVSGVSGFVLDVPQHAELQLLVAVRVPVQAVLKSCGRHAEV
jgi:hypothetical protein